MPVEAVALVGLGLVLAWLATSAALHRRRLARIPLRIHVAGTRGKSTTTRLIAQGLRAAGRRVVAKTTGTTPRLLLPDGDERPWPRFGQASIREQGRLVRRAVREGADALVVECMAIRPELVDASERFLLRAHLAVITNARPDHEEDLGGDGARAALALALVTPGAGVVVVGDEVAEGIVEPRAAALGTRVRRVAVAGLAPEVANRNLAVAVLEAVGAAAGTSALAGDPGDPGAFRIHDVAAGGRRFRLAAAFACNDAASLDLLLREHVGPAEAASLVVLLNARADRPERSRRLLALIAARRPRPRLVLAGPGLGWLRREARRAGFTAAEVTALRRADPDAALQALAALVPEGGLVFGIGNFHGLGEALTLRLGGGRPC